jgi:hypothetical protein
MSENKDSFVGYKIKRIEDPADNIYNWFVIVGKKDNVYYLDSIESYLKNKQNPGFEYDLKNGLCLGVEDLNRFYTKEKV